MNLAGNTENAGAWLQDFLTSDDSLLQRDVIEFGKSNIPTLLIWGEKDSITPLWQAEALHKMIRHSTVRTIPGIGHIPHLEASEVFNKILLEELCAQPGAKCQGTSP
jgi:pimeloyl-ACP methyl ester carboxylesterase